MDEKHRLLIQYLIRNGCVRRANPERQQALGARYKKGDEVRFTVDTNTELVELQSLLKQLGFQPGAPFVKNKKIVQPLYGKLAVATIVAWAEELHREDRKGRKGR